MEHTLLVSSSPHVHCGMNTRDIMRDVIIALTPALAASIWLFGLRALAVELVCVASALAAEYLSRRVMKRPQTVGDLSAVVTGLLLAFNLPATIPLWQAAFGSVVAIVVAKQMFGGLGQNFVNPALVGRIVLMGSFTAEMGNWVDPFQWLADPIGHLGAVDAVTSATPLAQMAVGVTDIDAVPVWYPWRLSRRDLCHCVDLGRFVFGDPSCDQPDDSRRLCRYRVRDDLAFGGRPSDTHFVRWSDAGRDLYGNRLCNLSDQPLRQIGIRHWLRLAHRFDPLVRFTAGRCVVCYRDYEYSYAAY